MIEKIVWRVSLILEILFQESKCKFFIYPPIFVSQHFITVASSSTFMSACNSFVLIYGFTYVTVTPIDHIMSHISVAFLQAKLLLLFKAFHLFTGGWVGLITSISSTWFHIEPLEIVVVYVMVLVKLWLILCVCVDYRFMCSSEVLEDDV